MSFFLSCCTSLNTARGQGAIFVGAFTCIEERLSSNDDDSVDKSAGSNYEKKLGFADPVNQFGFGK